MLNPQLDLAFNFVENTGVNIFLTGRAGTGKTTFLHDIRKLSPKRMVVVAPTGVAAINAGGVTIHSFFQLPYGYFIPNTVRKDREIRRFSKIKIRIIRSMELLVIDEISMVRADMLDAIDDVLRRYRGNSLPFGGVQLLMIGDLQQLSPVIKNEEWDVLKDFYNTPYFFDSLALKSTRYRILELKHIYRQQNSHFIELLAKVRDGNLDAAALNDINARYIENFTHDNNSGYITLTSHNHIAKKVNDCKLSELDEQEYIYTAFVNGDFPESQYPVEHRLVLKNGTQVMFTRNDSPEKRYVNGTIGEIISISEDNIEVKIISDSQVIDVEIAQWENIKYSLDNTTKEITEIVDGTFSQYPLKPAWAITIHKSQGLTFDKVIIDAANSFSHGQVYVALSRCRTLEGVILSSPIRSNSIKKDLTVQCFSDDAEKHPLTEQNLLDDKRAYYHAVLIELFDFTQLIINLRYSRRQLEENLSNVYPKLIEKWNAHLKLFIADINDVSIRFKMQIDGLMQNSDYANDLVLADRITKGVIYFMDKCESIVVPLLSTLDVDIDNKDVKKSILRSKSQLEENCKLKMATLESCKDSFTISNYLKAKSDILATEQQRAKASRKESLKSVETVIDNSEIDDIMNEELFEELREWRKGKAGEIGRPLYIIAHQKVLITIAAIMPTTLEELGNIKGVGKTFMTKYGNDIMTMLKKYSQN